MSATLGLRPAGWSDWVCDNLGPAGEGTIWETRGGRKDFLYSGLMELGGHANAPSAWRPRGL
ncbi:hypothetical protein GCM10020219_091100 [Nonomuraea dietziae]